MGILVKTVQVEWKQGYVSRGVPAEAAYEVLEAVRRKMGVVRPDDVVAVAADPNSAINPLFTWDDQEAARLWRRHEAQEMIRALQVRVVVPERSSEPVRVRALVRVALHTYVPLEEAQEKKVYRRAVLEEARKELEAAREKFRTLSLVFGEVVMAPALDGVQRSLALLEEAKKEEK